MNIPVAIKGIEFALPKLEFNNDDMAKIVDTSDEWITQRTGIKTRRIVSGDESTVSLANDACKKLVEKLGIDPLSIDMIISATSAPDRCYPTVAGEVQNAIGADNASAFEMVAACTGFLYAMQLARANINSGFTKKVLIVASDSNSKFLDWSDRTSCILFGDGASAALLEVSKDGKDDIIDIELASDGAYKELISLNVPSSHCPLAELKPQENNYYIQMAGKEVYKYVMKKIPAIIQKTLDKANMTINDIDFFVPHQANLRMIEALAERIGISDDKALHNLEKYGNISAASIPCVIKESIDNGVIKKGSKLLLSAFGAGMTSGGAIVELNHI